MTADEVIAEISRRAWRFGVSVLLSPDEAVDSGGFPSGGYFDGIGKTLAVATGGRSEESWLGTLLHEYCHLTQWVEQSPDWLGYGDGMWTWLEGKAVRNHLAAIRAVQSLEADCERRTIRLIQEMDAPIDLESYTRAANAYIHFHNVIADTRKWYRPDVVMGDLPDLLAAANPTFDRDFSKTPVKLRKQLEALV
jgi:hypothetical protein